MLSLCSDCDCLQFASDEQVKDVLKPVWGDCEEIETLQGPPQAIQPASATSPGGRVRSAALLLPCCSLATLLAPCCLAGLFLLSLSLMLLSCCLAALSLPCCSPAAFTVSLTHSLSLVLVVMMRSREFKTKIAHAHSPDSLYSLILSGGPVACLVDWSVARLSSWECSHTALRMSRMQGSTCIR